MSGAGSHRRGAVRRAGRGQDGQGCRCSCRQRGQERHGCGRLFIVPISAAGKGMQVVKVTEVDLRNGPNDASGKPYRLMLKFTPVPFEFDVPATYPRMPVVLELGRTAV